LRSSGSEDEGDDATSLPTAGTLFAVGSVEVEQAPSNSSDEAARTTPIRAIFMSFPSSEEHEDVPIFIIIT